MDCVDFRKYRERNNNVGFLLNIIDVYTKYLWSFPLQHKSAEAVIKDNGRVFKNTLIQDCCIKNNIAVIHGSPQNPKSQGISKPKNKEEAMQDYARIN